MAIRRCLTAIESRVRGRPQRDAGTCIQVQSARRFLLAQTRAHRRGALPVVRLAEDVHENTNRLVRQSRLAHGVIPSHEIAIPVSSFLSNNHLLPPETTLAKLKASETVTVSLGASFTANSK